MPLRAVVQRVTRASVSVAGDVVGRIDEPGLVALVGVTHDDGPDDIEWMARKIADLRILRDERSACDELAPVLVVSQFTLYADIRKGLLADQALGNRAQDGARQLAASHYDPNLLHVESRFEIPAVVEALRERGLQVETGAFGADMRIEILADGPVTLVLDSRTS